MRIGFDLGNVLCASDTEFLTKGDLTAAQRIPGGFETVAAAVAQNGPESNWIVSACGPRVQGFSGKWLRQEGFFTLTGFHESCFALPRRFELDKVAASLRENHVLFCEKRPHKAIIAAVLGLEAFVDDRIQVLQELPDCVRLRIAFRPKAEELAKLDDDRIVVVQDWLEVRELLELTVWQCPVSIKRGGVYLYIHKTLPYYPAFLLSCRI
ncbi:MAG TPA: hypothetical protein VD907_02915 [Verrucomicrobiae bacterium]|nr:hypothetical protein [Verrucomicrobiae bacterium]